MIIEALGVAEEHKRTVLYHDWGDRKETIEVANGVPLATYLKTINRVVTEPTTLVIFGRESKPTLGSIFGNGAFKPNEVITDGIITQTEHFGTHLEIPGASYTGWTASQSWEEAPFDFFVNTSLRAEDFKRIARFAEATQLLLAFNRGIGSNVGVKLRPTVTFPFK